MDFRIQKAIGQWLERRWYIGDVDLVSIAGACHDLVAEPGTADFEHSWKQLNLSKRLHNITRVTLTQHEDCATYGGTAAFVSASAAKDRLLADMRRAKEAIRAKWSDVDVMMFWIYQKDGGWDLEEVS